MCNKVMKVRPSHYERKKYCSRKCKAEYQRVHPPKAWESLSKKQTIKCSNCSTEFLRKASCISERNFCTKSCRNEYLRNHSSDINQHLKKRVVVICKMCGQSFEVIKSREATAKYCSKNCLGKANGNRGKVDYRKQVKVTCAHCNIIFEKKPSVVKKYNFCSTNCMGEFYRHSKMFSGTNSGTWAGGKANYYGENWRTQRALARKRDNYTCQDCGITEKQYKQELSVHHIIPFKNFDGDWEKANHLSNLITLCEYPCHRQRHSKNNTN